MDGHGLESLRRVRNARRARVFWHRNLKAEGFKLNVDLADEIMESEGPQFIRRGLEGGVRLLRQGGFTLPESLNKWRAKEDVTPVRDALCVGRAQTGNDWIASSDAHEACSAWCRSMGATTPSPKAVGAFLTGKYGVPRSRGGRHYYPVLVRNAGEKPSDIQ